MLIIGQRDRFLELQRYETARREHLGAAINLVFALAAAALGFCGVVIVSKESTFSGPGNYLLVAASVLFSVTILLSVSVTLTRLFDLRITGDKIRNERPGRLGAELKSLEDKMDRLGTVTWRLFYTQLGSFVFGVLLLVFAMWFLYYDKLFLTA